VEALVDDLCGQFSNFYWKSQLAEDARGIMEGIALEVAKMQSLSVVSRCLYDVKSMIALSTGEEGFISLQKPSLWASTRLSARVYEEMLKIVKGV
jgi:hypothetical protein